MPSATAPTSFISVAFRGICRVYQLRMPPKASGNMRLVRLDAMAELRVAVPGGPGGGVTKSDVAIRDLGRCTFPSPVASHLGDENMVFVGAADKVLVNDQLSQLPRDPEALAALPAFE